MQRYNVDGLNFDFSDNWQVGQYDSWSFYRNQVSRMWNGINPANIKQKIRQLLKPVDVHPLVVSKANLGAL